MMPTTNYELEQLQLTIKQAIQTRLHDVLPHAQFYILAMPILLLLLGGLLNMIVGVFTSNSNYNAPNKYCWKISVLIVFITSIISIIFELNHWAF